jgi:hypothetical protein
MLVVHLLVVLARALPEVERHSRTGIVEFVPVDHTTIPLMLGGC